MRAFSVRFGKHRYRGGIRIAESSMVSEVTDRGQIAPLQRCSDLFSAIGATISKDWGLRVESLAQNCGGL